MLNPEKIIVLIRKIKEKKELADLSDKFVEESVLKVLMQESRLLKELEKNFHLKSFSFKQIVKKTREILRRNYGLFRVKEELKERKKILEEVSNRGFTAPVIKKVLLSHSSTKERLSFYGPFYKKLFEMTGKPQSILDLGCGLHPFSIPEMKLKKLHYHALDLSEEEINLLNQFFSFWHQKNKDFLGKAEVFDLTKTAQLSLLKKHDLAFLLKMTDVLDKGKGHKKTEEVLQAILADYVVISFPTKTMSGQEMNVPRRPWMEWLCKRLGYDYTLFSFGDELFYVVRKRPLVKS